MEKITYHEFIANYIHYIKNQSKGFIDRYSELDLFFVFISSMYPLIWDKLNQWYADDYSCWDLLDPNSSYERNYYRYPKYLPNPRFHLHGWEEILNPDDLSYLLRAIEQIWPKLTEQNYGICSVCKEEKELDIEHRVIVSYDFGPVFKVYEAFEMDGSVNIERYLCRKCATEVLNSIVTKMDPEEETCWV
jgi:hypothetical protein